ncbi:hypothetical protein OG349_33200 [Streptomyces sp. NBC_01317]|uniref:hypothetical protein n=1 Tax=Streptomyces sp. NBC_01317 TaxID=2903822 RepID=UPI002E16290C|nr:hypothetical protein OG349_33200 [Streptomyces sp. NBC_01317]
MKAGEGEDALVLAARERLAAGQDEEEVVAQLAARTGEWHACVLAVCLAVGVPRTDAEARLRHVERCFAEFEPGEEELLSSLLVMGDTFIVDAVLDEHDEHIRGLLETAAGVRGGFPGGLITWFRTGELTKLFLYFARVGIRAGRGSPPDFWAALTAAGELLAAEDGPDQAEVRAGLERCRGQGAALGAK